MIYPPISGTGTMANIEKQLKEWSEQGLISPEQASKIISHESGKKRTSWIQYGILSLGVFITGLGIISLIAANWNNIDDAVKLAVDFTLLSLIAFFAARAHNSKKLILYDSLLFALQVTALATIGLISQIFHTSGELYQAILFWSVFSDLIAHQMILVCF